MFRINIIESRRMYIGFAEIKWNTQCMVQVVRDYTNNFEWHKDRSKTLPRIRKIFEEQVPFYLMVYRINALPPPKKKTQVFCLNIDRFWRKDLVTDKKKNNQKPKKEEWCARTKRKTQHNILTE